MKQRRMKIAGAVAASVAAVALLGTSAVSCEKKDVSRKSSESAVVTNENGSVSRTFTESTISTNGNMVTERRRETRTTMDTDGNMLETSTSEYAQSYTVGDVGLATLAGGSSASGSGEPQAAVSDSFMGLKFGDEFKCTNFVEDAEEPTLLRAEFKPAKTLAGFDDYYVYVTPKTHRVVKVYACAKEAVEPGARWRRH